MKSLSIELADRTLRFDGVSIITPQQVVGALLRGVPPANLRLTEHSADTELFNDNSVAQLQLAQPEPVNLDFDWQLPAEYLQLDIYEVANQAVGRYQAEMESKYSPEQLIEAMDRVLLELAEFEKRGMTNFLRTIIYVLDIFRQEKVVWGVGRGSSCASYVLFLLGLHSVDCVWYNVPMNEFFHD